MYLYSGIFDLPAKCLVQEMIQYNGEYGCSMCESPGEPLTTDAGGHVRVFPKHHPGPENEAIRTHEKTIAQAEVCLFSKINGQMRSMHQVGSLIGNKC